MVRDQYLRNKKSELEVVKKRKIEDITTKYKTCSSSTIEETVDINKINHSSSSLKWNFDKICQLNDKKKKLKFLF